MRDKDSKSEHTSSTTHEMSTVFQEECRSVPTIT